MDFSKRPASYMISYINCTTHRCGTHFLKDLLSNNNCGNAHELFFYIGKRNIKFTLDEFIEAGTKGGIFGVSGDSIFIHHGMEMLKEMSGIVEWKDDFHILNIIFPNIKYIYLYRENIIKQAISFLKAINSGHYSLKCNPDFGEYSEKDISNKIETLQRHNAQWCKFFKKYNIMPYVLTYELLCENTEKEIQGILNYLGIKRDLINTKVTRRIQYDQISEEWYQRYIHEKGEEINEIFSDSILAMLGNRYSRCRNL